MVSSWHSSTAFQTEAALRGHLMPWKKPQIQKYDGYPGSSFWASNFALPQPMKAHPALHPVYTERWRKGCAEVTKKWHEVKKQNENAKLEYASKSSDDLRLHLEISKLLSSNVKYQRYLLYDAKNVILPTDFWNLLSISQSHILFWGSLGINDLLFYIWCCKVINSWVNQSVALSLSP